MRTWIRGGILALLILAAAGLWWTEGREETAQPVQPTSAPSPAVHKTQRMKRETSYQQDLSALQALLDSGAADEATQELAAQKMTQLISEHQNEIGLEEALQEAGYTGAVVIIQNGAVTVMIPPERLNETTSAQILELCVAHAGVGPANVRIMGFVTNMAGQM